MASKGRHKKIVIALPQRPPWRFRDFAHNARSVIEQEITATGASVAASLRAKLNMRLLHLQWQRVLKEPYAKKLSGECQSLFEIKILVRNIQYRPLMWQGPQRGEMTILMLAQERGGDWVPRDACARAHERRRLVESDAKRVVDHRYDAGTAGTNRR